MTGEHQPHGTLTQNEWLDIIENLELDLKLARDEIERMRAALGRFIPGDSYSPTAASICEYEFCEADNEHPEAHGENCAIRIAWDALNREATT